jgi:predicted hydrocarbon binding protein
MKEGRYNRIKEEWDVDRGEFFVIGYRTLMLSNKTFVRIQKEAEKILGDGAAVIFYEAGKKAVLVSVKRIEEEWKLEGEELIRGLEEFYAEVGFGKFIIGKAKAERELIIKVENSFIAKEYGKSDVPVCHFIRGYCAGIGETLTNQAMDAEEVKCVACGDDHCEFVVKTVE